MIFKFSTALSLAVLAAGTAHSQSRELDAHLHGHGTLNIAFEGKSVAMELEAPGADIVGFEHPAETAEDRSLIDAAIAQLAKPLELFVIPAAAGCTVTAANVELMGEDDHEEGHEGEHDDKNEHVEGQEDEDEHAEDHKDEDDHKDEHADEAGEEGHNEFHAEYALTCADPTAIDAIEFAYFERFPNAAELDIQMISDKGAKGFEVERDEPRLSLSGAI